MAWQVGEYTTEGEKPFDNGSFGTLWKGRRLSDGARVALKLVLSTGCADARERIDAERHGAMLQQRFEQAHGMVPKVYDYGYDGDGNLFIAMELIEGGALSELIKSGPLAAHSAAEHALRICDFLDKAHGFATVVEGETYDRLVHADLKPGHVLIPSPGDVKVLDFGIAKALAKTTQVTTNNWGTPAYASPERLDRGHVNEYVDFWSLGIILYEMVSGHRPYPDMDRNRSQLEHAIRTNAPRAPLPDSCPAQLSAIISKLLASQMERRYPTAAAIRSDLELFLAGETPSATTEYVTPATMPIGQTARRLPVAPQSVPSTEPLPAAPPPVPPAAPVSPRAAVAAPPSFLRRAAWVLVLLSLVGLVTREGVAWVAAERFREGISALDGSRLTETRHDYDSIRGWGVLDAGLHLRVNGPLRQRLTALADIVLADYRREDPTMGPAEWAQAQDALRWAAQLTPNDRRLMAKQLICEAHVAIDKFRAASALDEDSFDPYLGISRIAVYGLGDVDQAAAAVQEAEERGYKPGRRERALLGDGYLKRATAARALARSLSGDQRRRETERARDDYARCIEAFDPIVGFGKAAQNLELCKRSHERLEQELAATDDKPQEL
jgi:hypothetical protein